MMEGDAHFIQTLEKGGYPLAFGDEDYQLITLNQGEIITWNLRATSEVLTRDARIRTLPLGFESAIGPYGSNWQPNRLAVAGDVVALQVGAEFGVRDLWSVGSPADEPLGQGEDQEARPEEKEQTPEAAASLATGCPGTTAPGLGPPPSASRGSLSSVHEIL